MITKNLLSICSMVIQNKCVKMKFYSKFQTISFLSIFSIIGIFCKKNTVFSTFSNFLEKKRRDFDFFNELYIIEGCIFGAPPNAVESNMNKYSKNGGVQCKFLSYPEKSQKN